MQRSLQQVPWPCSCLGSPDVGTTPSHAASITASRQRASNRNHMLQIISLFVACGFLDGKLPCCNPVASSSFVTLPWLGTGDTGAEGGCGRLEGCCQPPPSVGGPWQGCPWPWCGVCQPRWCCGARRLRAQGLGPGTCPACGLLPPELLWRRNPVGFRHNFSSLASEPALK